MSSNYTPNYAALKNDPAIFALAFASLLASPYLPTPVNAPARLDLSNVTVQIERAATVAAHIIADNSLTFRSANSRDEYLESKSRAIADTYLRAFELNELGHFDGVEATIADAVLERAHSRFQWPEAANAQGLALLDIHLKSTAQALRPLLAKQTTFELELVG